jgi:hypothetical protein
MALDNAIVDSLRSDLIRHTCDPLFSQCEEYGINVKDAKYSTLIKMNNLKFSAIIAADAWWLEYKSPFIVLILS